MKVYINGNEVSDDKPTCAFCGFSSDSLMVFTTNGKFVCAVCGREWSGVSVEVNGRRFFFCCDAHAKRFMKMLGEVHRFVNIKLVDRLDVWTDVDGRVVDVYDINGNVHRLKVRV